MDKIDELIKQKEELMIERALSFAQIEGLTKFIKDHAKKYNTVYTLRIANEFINVLDAARLKIGFLIKAAEVKDQKIRDLDEEIRRLRTN